jgi:FKBP-type peptidyl-prolyl cis-trans isomerase FklB
MKKIGNLVILSAIGLFIISSCISEKKYAAVKIKSKEDSVSYYLGLTYGSGLKQAKIDSVFNYQAFVKGMTEALGKDTLPVSQFAIQSYLNSYFMAFQQEQVKNEYKDYIAENKAFLDANSKKDSVVTLPSGLQYIVLHEGKGNKPATSDRIKVHYTGTLIDGTIFDSSYQRNQPAEFNVGEVIPGWTEAMQLMSVGSKWRIFIPENLAYGSQSPQGSAIKPFSTLIFEVELLDIVPSQNQ